MLEYDGPIVCKNRELSEFVHEILDICDRPRLDVKMLNREWVGLKRILIKALLAREVPYSHPIYGALEPKGSVANVCKR